MTMTPIYVSQGAAFSTRFHVWPNENSDHPVHLQQSGQSLQGTLWVAKNPKHPQVDSKDSDQPMLMYRSSLDA